MLILLKQYWYILLILLRLLLLSLAHRFPAVTERLYSRGIYKILKETYGRLFSLLPFAAASFSYICIFLMIFVITSTNYSHLLLLLGFIFIFGIANHLPNYARKTFASATGLEIREASEEELAGLCKELVGKINEVAPCVNRNENGQTVLSTKNHYDLSKKAHAAFKNLSYKYPNLGLGGFTPTVKPMPRFMLYKWRIGVYNSLTMETFVSFGNFGYSVPFAMAHEIAHFKGYAREDEANFISYLACIESDEPEFIYSGLMVALGYVHTKMHELNADEYVRIMLGLSKEAWIDWQHWEHIAEKQVVSNPSEENANKPKNYLKKFRGYAIRIFDNINHIMLKINRQSDGHGSYGRVFDLLLADYRKRRGVKRCTILHIV